MILAIDYDNCYTEAPAVWNKVIKLFQDAGHTVICVSARTSESAMARPVLESIGKLVPVVFAGTLWKKEAAEKRGYKVSVWIDDMPGLIEPQFLLGNNG